MKKSVPLIYQKRKKQKAMFHISRKYIGDNATFTPSIPVSQNKSEIEMPSRVCASPTVSQCWEAIKVCQDLFDLMREQRGVGGYYFFIYKFDNATDFSPNYEIYDFEKTNEHIALSAQKATLVKTVWVNKYCLRSGFDKVAEDVEFAEAIEQEEEWQREMMRSFERIVEEMEW